MTHAGRAPLARGTRPVGRGVGIAAALALGASLAIVGTDAHYTPGSGLGYGLGLCGGLMMLALLIYPLRKSVAALHTWGPVKYWFRAHMILGVAGPLMILFHSTFQFRSINAVAAFGAMVLVVASGIVGRFLYARIHHGLYGSLATLEEMQVEREKSEGEVGRLIRVVPAIAPLLADYTAMALAQHANPIARIWHFLRLGLRTWRTWRKCRSHLLHTLEANAHAARHSRADIRRQYRAARGLVRAYLRAAQRAAQFRVYARLFSLWHAVHIPFIYILAASAIVHVVAVHMY